MFSGDVISTITERAQLELPHIAGHVGHITEDGAERGKNLVDKHGCPPSCISWLGRSVSKDMCGYYRPCRARSGGECLDPPRKAERRQAGLPGMKPGSAEPAVKEPELLTFCSGQRLLSDRATEAYACCGTG